MRLLFIPNPTKIGEDLCLDSSYKTMRDLRLEFGEEAYVYWILPGQARDSEKRLDEKHNFFLYESFPLQAFDFRDDVVDSDLVNRFMRRYGDWVIDGVVTMRKGSPVQLLRLNDIYRHTNTRLGQNRLELVPVFMLEMNAWHHKNFKDVLNAVGYYCSHPIFYTELERAKGLRYAAEYLSGSVVQVIRDHAIVAPQMMDFDLMDRLTADVEKGREIIKVFLGARINKLKGSPEIFDAYAYLFSAGREHVNVIITTITDDTSVHNCLKAQIGKWGKFYRYYPSCPWEKYLQYAKASHVSVVASVSESFGAAYVEALNLGVILLLPDADWARQLVPLDYSFFYRNKNELHTLLAWVVDHYEEAWEKFKHVPEWVRAKYDKQSSAFNMAREIRRVVESHRQVVWKKCGRWFEKQQGLMARVLELRDELSWEEYTRNIQKQSDGIKFPQSEKLRRRRTPSNYEFYLFMLNREGFEDTCDSTEPRFIRERGKS